MPKSLNDLTSEDVKMIKDMAAVFYTPKEIAIALEVDIALFVDACEYEGNEYYTAFNGARLRSDYELRTSIVKLAKSGSSPAQVMSLDMLNKSKIKLSDK